MTQPKGRVRAEMMLLAALFGTLVQFYEIPVPVNIVSPQTPSFALAGFKVHYGGRDTDADAPQYLSETERMRAAALIRFKAPTTGLCSAYELSTPGQDGRVHRIGPLPVLLNPNFDNTIPIRSGLDVKIMVLLYDARDIQENGLPLQIEHRTVGVECVRGTDGHIFFSRLYRVDPSRVKATQS
jgi:hypothetical protein